MKITRPLVLILVIIVSVVLCPEMADSQEAGVGSDTNTPSLLKNNDKGNGKENGIVDPTRKIKVDDEATRDSTKQLESKMGENEGKDLKQGAKHQQKDNKQLHLDSTKESDEGKLTSVRRKCDSSSNSCTNDDKTLVACLRVPGNESPELSLLIQNKGKGSLTVKISAPDLVQLAKKQVELQEKEDTEVKVSIGGVENGHLIVLTAGHGNCTLDFRDQFAARTKVDPSSNATSFTIFSQSSSARLVFVALLLIAVVLSVVTGIGLWRRYFARKVPTYQKLDTVLPISHSGKQEQTANDGWDDDGWGESWDDEEAPSTPAMPVTPSLSSRGIILSRKFSNKEGWKD